MELAVAGCDDGSSIAATGGYDVDGIATEVNRRHPALSRIAVLLLRSSEF